MLEAQKYHKIIPFIAFLCVVLFTWPFFNWWLEDDVYQRAFILSLDSPLTIFTNSHQMFAFDMSRTFVPWLAFSEYLDIHLAPYSPVFSNLHNTVSFALTSFFLFYWLKRVLPVKYAVLALCLWIYLPSTILISEWTAVRHYLEGLLFSVLALLVLEKTGDKSQPLQGVVYTLCVCLLYYLSAISKEIYVTFTFYMISILFIKKKNYVGIGFLCLTGLLYLGHRFLYFGGLGSSSLVFSPSQLLGFEVLPFSFSGNHAGAVVFIVVLIMNVVILLKKHPPITWLVCLGGLFTLLFPLMPVIQHLDSDHQMKTWYRLVFLFNTVFVIGTVFSIKELSNRKLKVAISTAVLLCLLSGSVSMSNKIDKLRIAYKLEAAFYLENPDKLLFSQVPYAQYISNVHDLFCPDDKRHYIDWQGLMDRGVIHSTLLEYDTIWVYQDGEYKPDTSIYMELINKNMDRSRPLLKPRKIL
ncbi:MAG: hypothetical protein CR997_08530 [Acidobacteria bacterium]|nr:MAG: hypothetical protein CR997_08530 [Acidobacteriota bacterium]